MNIPNCNKCLKPITYGDFFYSIGIGCQHMGYQCPYCKAKQFVPFEAGHKFKTIKSKKLAKAESQPRLL